MVEENIAKLRGKCPFLTDVGIVGSSKPILNLNWWDEGYGIAKIDYTIAVRNKLAVGLGKIAIANSGCSIGIQLNLFLYFWYLQSYFDCRKGCYRTT